tara:strand:- start:55 stop:528 length:474 start_codon:yes stop_codon:yes gene_type:complete
MEKYKDIKGFEGVYKASNYGNVKSLKFGKERFLKLSINGHGYSSVGLSNGGKMKSITVHQLMALTFLNHTPKKGLVIDHIDNNRLNNNIDNLQIITHRENISKDKKGGTSKYIGVHWCKAKKGWISQITINYKIKYLGRFLNELEASKAYQQALSLI